MFLIQGKLYIYIGNICIIVLHTHLISPMALWFEYYYTERQLRPLTFKPLASCCHDLQDEIITKKK